MSPLVPSAVLRIGCKTRFDALLYVRKVSRLLKQHKGRDQNYLDSDSYFVQPGTSDPDPRPEDRCSEPLVPLQWASIPIVLYRSRLIFLTNSNILAFVLPRRQFSSHLSYCLVTEKSGQNGHASDDDGNHLFHRITINKVTSISNMQIRHRSKHKM